jgi:hypothetical protein
MTAQRGFTRVLEAITLADMVADSAAQRNPLAPDPPKAKIDDIERQKDRLSIVSYESRTTWTMPHNARERTGWRP